ncbi:uncharacterized protein N7482_005712 [Penicillium canariense]|uniref:Uncharacterized protein n=1 Tax=Penicillium canariense TaxID=189055 RepID=A0A9W9LN98_9EURO|nr:uncharacterized protein N7482_005712 [Penicillium canariense]KAJ5166931.1 hypothetical protein N7482_005712 [Penicillium canariense]
MARKETPGSDSSSPLSASLLSPSRARGVESKASSPTPIWDLKSAFARLVEEDTVAWKNLGVERSPRHIVPPSGSIDSPIAFHLYNPTSRAAEKLRVIYVREEPFKGLSALFQLGIQPNMLKIPP